MANEYHVEPAMRKTRPTTIGPREPRRPCHREKSGVMTAIPRKLLVITAPRITAVPYRSDGCAGRGEGGGVDSLKEPLL